MPVNGLDIAAKAQQYLGLKYVWGGTSLASGADCSGYLQSVYAQFGISVPRVTYNQINSGSKVAYSDLQSGDMVFFDTDPSVGGPDHVGMYIGDGKFIHSPRPGDSVKISSMNDGYYSARYMAARRPDGMVGGGKDAPNADMSGPVAPRLEPEELAASYGWAYGFLNSEPELRGLFSQAVEGTWSTSKFQAALRNTNWWKTNSQKSREAAMLAATDPATFSAQVNASVMLVRNKANEMGAIITDKIANQIGEDMVRTGMEEAQLQHALAGYINFSEEGVLGGQAGIAAVRLNQLARMNGVQMPKEAVRNFAQQIAMGVTTIEQAEQHVRNMAKSMFPTYGEQIDSGMNMADIAQPYMQIVSDELEIPSVDADLTSSLVKQGLMGMDKDGKPFGMSLTDFQNFVRQDPRWLQTGGAREKMTNVGMEVLSSLGIVA